MKAIVTGHGGFVGSHLVEALRKRGWDVYGIGLPAEDRPRAEWWDLRIMKTLPYPDVDVVFHTAAIARTPWAVADPVLCWDTNLMGAVRLLEACRQAEVKRVVLSSSNIVYAGTTPYKASKLAMEAAAKVYYDLYDLNVICLRYGNTYGPRQSEEGTWLNVLPSLRKSLREKGWVGITGDGSQSRDFVHVSDVVRANLLAAERVDQSGVFDICTGRNVSLLEIAALVGAEVRHLPERLGDVKHIYQDPKPAEKKLGFKAKVQLERGIWDSFPQEAINA